MKEQMRYCVSHPEEISKIAKVKAQVSEVKGVMMENIEKVNWHSSIILGYKFLLSIYFIMFGLRLSMVVKTLYISLEKYLFCSGS